MEVKAKLSNLRVAPRKVRLVADLVRGKSVNQALKQLSFSQKKAAGPVKKLIESAVANATNQFKLNKDGLVIKTIRVDEGTMLKRWRPRAFGRASMIRKRSSHIHLILNGEKDAKAAKDEKSAKAEKPEKDNVGAHGNAPEEKPTDTSKNKAS